LLRASPHRARSPRAQAPSPLTTTPFMARLLLEYANGDLYLCGGSLISPTAVLTAAHCLKDTPTNMLMSIIVRLGARASAFLASCSRACALRFE